MIRYNFCFGKVSFAFDEKDDDETGSILFQSFDGFVIKLFRQLTLRTVEKIFVVNDSKEILNFGNPDGTSKDEILKTLREIHGNLQEDSEGQRVIMTTN